METSLVALILVVVAVSVLVLPLWGARERKGLKSMLARYQAITDALLGDDLPRARDELKDLIRTDTDDVGAYLRLAKVFRREGRHDRAVAIHRSLTARDIGDRGLKQEVLSGLAEDLVHLQQYAEARPVVEALRQIERRHPLFHRVTLHQALEQEDWEGARRALGALRRGGKLASEGEADAVRTWIAARQAASGQESEACKLLEEVLRDRPEYVPATLLLGDLWVGRGEFERAAALWTDLLERRVVVAPHLIQRLEKVYFELGRFGELERLFEAAMAREGSGCGALRLALARMALRKGEAERALALMEEALQRDPQDPEARQWYLYLLMEAGRGEEARRALKTELEAALALAQSQRCPYCRQAIDGATVRCPHCAHWIPELVGAAAAAVRRT